MTDDETTRALIEKLGLEYLEKDHPEYDDICHERDEIAEQAWNLVGMTLQSMGYHRELLDENAKALLDMGIMSGMSAAAMHVTEKYLKGDGNE